MEQEDITTLEKSRIEEGLKKLKTKLYIRMNNLNRFIIDSKYHTFYFDLLAHFAHNEGVLAKLFPVEKRYISYKKKEFWFLVFDNIFLKAHKTTNYNIPMLAFKYCFRKAAQKFADLKEEAAFFQENVYETMSKHIARCNRYQFDVYQKKTNPQWGLDVKLKHSKTILDFVETRKNKKLDQGATEVTKVNDEVKSINQNKKLMKIQKIYDDVFYRKYHNIEKIEFNIVKKDPNLKRIFSKTKTIELKPKPMPRNFSLVGFPPVQNIKFVPSYSPVRNLSKTHCQSCQEITMILEEEMRTRQHFVRDNQIQQIKANNYLRNTQSPRSFGFSTGNRPVTVFKSHNCHSSDVISNSQTKLQSKLISPTNSNNEVEKPNDAGGLMSPSNILNQQELILKLRTKSNVGSEDFLSDGSCIRSDPLSEECKIEELNQEYEQIDPKEEARRKLFKLDKKYGLCDKRVKSLNAVKRAANNHIRQFSFNSKDFYYNKVVKIEEKKDTKYANINKLFY